MAVAIRVDRIEWYTAHEDGLDGAIWYEVFRDGEYLFPLRQPFARSGLVRTPAGSLVWLWDGNRDAPTLSDPRPNGGQPSFKAISHGVEVHFTYTAGRVVPHDGLQVVP